MYEIIRFDLEKKKKKAEIFYLQIKNDFFFLDILLERMKFLTNLGLFEVWWILSDGDIIRYHHKIIVAQVTVVLASFVKAQNHRVRYVAFDLRLMYNLWG